ncbi:hypothetical protein PPYR_01131 [Photinus pyralis]|uniref:5-formyltetrahydrofolate cyclo-ligase n=1 Tax=Photinus pyralis TaxID=7054 RepID=A0A1Y1MCK7_PHOPY|nr:5-formyltetrahydrofolate cyclo-ligase [Photinus pyralis]XP_031352867.1 5-formyltetrahydrofolate cyclo-ligase [Photinus pyralis]KAB0804161.1 hypothetical protein PPYR_01131 [Photinus pyralis]
MPSAVQAVQAAKSALRKTVQGKLALVSRDEKKIQSEKVLTKLFKLPAFVRSQRVSVYLSTEDEISTEPIIRRIFESRKACYVPRYHKNQMEMVKLHSMEDWETLPLTKWNIKQPRLAEQRENALDTGGLDLVIVPGVAFTADGDRMGHGKGYYDTFLRHLYDTQSKPPITVALAFKEQVLNEVPLQEHDVKIDLILYIDRPENEP